MKIRDLVSVKSQPTVVRLDHLQQDDTAWITENYYLTDDVKAHIFSLSSLFRQEAGCGAFLIGHYGSGKSHFLAWLSRMLHNGELTDRKLKVIPISLVNFSARHSLESIVAETLKLENVSADRRLDWQQLQNAFPDGILLVIDELSEFLRSRPQTGFNEDIRFLQFLGEWSQNHALWILAALQEQIEHTGEIEYDLFRKIKDRYPIRMILTPTHVKDLIGERILVKHEGYPEAVEKLIGQLRRAFPNNPMNYEDFAKIYPLHPVTLDLLEEVRDCFSQSRGIIGFTMHQLNGQEAKGIKPFLNQSWGNLLSPETIVDHFRDLFEAQSEFLPLAQKVFPYFRRQLPELFPNEAQNRLARRLVKLLVLVHLSPVRDSIDAREAAWWLLHKISTITPEKNVQILEQILARMASEGAYIGKKENRYFIDLREDAQEALETLVGRGLSEQKEAGDTLLESLAPFLKGSDFDLMQLDRERWQKHMIRWHFHDREFFVYLGGGEARLENGEGLQVGLPWGEPPKGKNCYRLIPKAMPVTDELREMSVLARLRERPLSPGLLQRIKERLKTRVSLFVAAFKAAYQQATLRGPMGEILAVQDVTLASVNDWKRRYAEVILRNVYPQFEGYAPSHGPLPSEAYRQLMNHSLTGRLEDEDAPELVRLIREAYLVPMKLMDRKGRAYRFSPKLDRHELVLHFRSILDHHPSPKRAHAHLTAPVFGLVPDQANLLLLVLMFQGDIDILKGRNAYRDIFDTFPDPRQYDKIVPGRALNQNQLRDLQAVCDGLGIQMTGPANVLAQRRVAMELKKLGRKERDRLGSFLTSLDQVDQTEALNEKVSRHIEQWLTLEKGESEIQGIQHFLFAVSSVPRFLEVHGELLTLPARFEKLISECRWLVNLLGHPAFKECPNQEIALSIEHLGAPPGLGEPDALEAWLDAARRIQTGHQVWYRKRHDAWWTDVSRSRLWSYNPPASARSRHLALNDTIQAFRAMRDRAAANRCRGLSDLDYQAICHCGFDGSGAPVQKEIRELNAMMAEIEQTLASFFQQESVRKKVDEWVDKGFDTNEHTLAYLDDKRDVPNIGNLELFDQHLAGLELFQEVSATRILDLLCARPWNKVQLTEELTAMLNRLGPRLSFTPPEAKPAVPDTLGDWCLEMALRTGTPLPHDFTVSQDLVARIQPEWISPDAMRHPERLGLGSAGLDHIFKLAWTGRVPLPDPLPDEGTMAALASVFHTPELKSADDLARAAALLYRAHAHLVKIGGSQWLTHLRDLAQTTLAQDLEDLTDLLRQQRDTTWLVLDCLGLPLLPLFEQRLADYLPPWKRVSTRFARVSIPTNTETFFRDLADSGVNKEIYKRNVVDDKVHEGNGNFTDLEKRIDIELEITCRKLVPQLPQSQPILIFADHGFRLNPEGNGFQHGGDSTLETVVPLFRLEPST